MKRKLIILWGLAAIVTLLWPAKGLAVPKDVVFYNDAVVGPDELYSVVTVYDSPPETTTIEFYGRGVYLMMNDSAVLNLRGEGWFGRRNWWDGFPPTESKLYDSSTVNIYEEAGFGSGIEAFLDLYDFSTLNIKGGVVDAVCRAYGTSTVDISDGLFSLALWLYDRSTVNVYGGTIDTYLANTSVPLTSTVNIYGYDFKYNHQGRWMPPMEPGGDGWWISKLTGYGFDGTPITYWGLPDPATNPNIHLIPEPATVLLLGLGGFCLLKNMQGNSFTRQRIYTFTLLGTKAPAASDTAKSPAQ